MSCKDKSHNHSISCAILTCAQSLLKCGLNDIIEEAINKSNNLKHRIHITTIICKLCCSVVLSQSQQILNTLNNLLDRYQCEKCTDTLMQNHIFMNNTHEEELKFCTVRQGKHGRMLCTDQSVGRGCLLLKEYPYVCIKTLHTCTCQDLVINQAHITLAIAIQRHKHQNRKKYDSFKQQFYSGIPTFTSNTNYHTSSSVNNISIGNSYINPTITRDDSIFWPISEQSLFILIAAIYCLYQNYTEGHTYYGSLQDLSSTSNQKDTFKYPNTSTLPLKQVLLDIQRNDSKFFEDSWDLFQILIRLPHNTHAITKVIKTNIKHASTNLEIQQYRIGYALFLSASSINHDCKPNAAIRFNYFNLKNDIISIEDNNDQALMEYLKNVYIEIVTTCSITNNEEVTISYGALSGKHHVKQRKDILLNQYLFHCTCKTCVEDNSNIYIKERLPKQCYENNIPIQYINDISQPSANSANISAVNTHAFIENENDRYLCKILAKLYIELNQSNTLFSEVLNLYHQNNNDISTINSFETLHINTLINKLVDIQIKYYPLCPILSNINIITEKNESIHIPYKDENYIKWCTIYCNVLDIHAHILALKSKFSIAASTISYTIQLMIHSKIYEHDDIVIGRERVKLMGLLFKSKDMKLCLTQANLARYILEPLVNKDDPDLQEISQMLYYIH